MHLGMLNSCSNDGFEIRVGIFSIAILAAQHQINLMPVIVS